MCACVDMFVWQDNNVSRRGTNGMQPSMAFQRTLASGAMIDSALSDRVGSIKKVRRLSRTSISLRSEGIAESRKGKLASSRTLANGTIGGGLFPSHNLSARCRASSYGSSTNHLHSPINNRNSSFPLSHSPLLPTSIPLFFFTRSLCLDSLPPQRSFPSSLHWHCRSTVQ